jgi:hypothetical protein
MTVVVGLLILTVVLIYIVCVAMHFRIIVLESEIREHRRLRDADTAEMRHKIDFNRSNIDSLWHRVDVLEQKKASDDDAD